MQKHRLFVSLLLTCILFSQILVAQVAINTDGMNPDNSAMLDVKSTTKGILLPRLTMAQRNAIITPARGLIIFQTDDTPGFYYNSGTSAAPVWIMTGTETNWGLNGNSGTNSVVNFLGTTDNQPLKFRVYDIHAGEINSSRWNTFLGVESGQSNIGTSNTGFGNRSLNQSDGQMNTSVGAQSQEYLTGNHNTSTGGFACRGLAIGSTGSYNTADGDHSLTDIHGGSYNTAAGSYALHSNTSGSSNTATGTDALRLNTTGYSNVAMGSAALYSNTTGHNLVAIGDSALYNQAIDPAGVYANTAVGSQALYMNTTGQRNTAIGRQALSSNATGSNNVAIGNNAMAINTASDNTAIGSYTMYFNHTGTNNVAVGGSALSHNNTGSNNTAVGQNALYWSEGNNNTAVGSSALFNSSVNTSFNSCNAFGYYALNQNTGGNNNAFGTGALKNNAGGTFNCAMGEDAMAVNISGSYNTVIGTYADVSADNLSNVTSLGNGAVADASDQVRLGNFNVSSLYCTGAFYGSVSNITRQLYADYNGKIGYLVSSARYKDNILDMENVEWLYRLRPVNYTYKSDDTKAKQYGLIAEEVETVVPEMVSYDKEGKPETVSYSTLITPMLKAIQEQRQKIETLERKNADLAATMEALLKRMEAMENRH